MDFKKTIKFFIAIVIILILVILYRTYNPAGNSFFPKCPFKLLTGLQCPGCGSQRTVHYLLNFDLLSALKENFMLVLAIPYVFVGFLFDMIGDKNQGVLKWRKILYGRNAILLILFLIILFWILRNII